MVTKNKYKKCAWTSTLIPLKLNSFDLLSYNLVSRKKHTKAVFGMCKGGDGFFKLLCQERVNDLTLGGLTLRELGSRRKLWFNKGPID